MAAIIEEVQFFYNEKNKKCSLKVYDFKWDDNKFLIKLCKEYKQKDAGIVNAKIETIALVTLEYEDNDLVDRCIEFFDPEEFRMLGYEDDWF